ncbi:MAG: ribonuclease D [Rhodobacteraceae bacterium]|nr:ribonuclease D [Paracoccaceae bacterium]
MSIIDTTQDLEAFCLKASKYPYVTIDTEFMREKTYYAKLCLIQLAFPEKGKDSFALIDPLAEKISLQSFFDLLANESVIKVFHSGRQDLEIFFNKTGALPKPIFDTQIAAMVCGFGDQVAYETLVNHIVEKRIDKSSRFTDWSKRPLTHKQIDYALSDVTFLRTIYEKLNEELSSSKRLSWVKEEFDILKNPNTYSTDPEQSWRKIKLRRKDNDFVKIIKSISSFRENEAQKRDLPRGHILRDEELIQIASQKPKKLQDLYNSRLPSKALKTGWIAEGIIECVKNSKMLPDEPLEEYQFIPLSASQLALVELLKVLLKFNASCHNVATKLIASSKDIEMIARHEKPNIRALEGWRFKIFGEDALKLKNGEISLTFNDAGLHLVTV